MADHAGINPDDGVEMTADIMQPGEIDDAKDVCSGFGSDILNDSEVDSPQVNSAIQFSWAR